MPNHALVKVNVYTPNWEYFYGIKLICNIQLILGMSAEGIVLWWFIYLIDAMTFYHYSKTHGGTSYLEALSFISIRQKPSQI